MAAVYDDSPVDVYQDSFFVYKPLSYVTVPYKHPVIDFCIENEVLMACDANHEVGAFDNPFYALLHNWFVPTNVWNEFQKSMKTIDNAKRSELLNKRKMNIEHEKKRYIRKYSKRIKKNVGLEKIYK